MAGNNQGPSRNADIEKRKDKFGPSLPSRPEKQLLKRRLKEMCIIINYSFKDAVRSQRREHSQKDIDKISRVARLLHLDVKLVIDLSIEKLRSKINELMSRVQQHHKMILVVLMIHGQDGDIRLTEEIISLDYFLQLFSRILNNAYLKKVFLLSYCLGDERNKETPLVDHRLEFVNMLIGFSTLPDHECFSNENGDIFIQKWFNILELHLNDRRIIDAIQIQIKCETWFCNNKIIITTDNETTRVYQQPWHKRSVEQMILETSQP